MCIYSYFVIGEKVELKKEFQNILKSVPTNHSALPLILIILTNNGLLLCTEYISYQRALFQNNILRPLLSKTIQDQLYTSKSMCL